MKLFYYVLMSSVFVVSLCKAGGNTGSTLKPHIDATNIYCAVSMQIRERLKAADSISQSLTGSEDSYFFKCCHQDKLGKSAGAKKMSENKIISEMNTIQKESRKMQGARV